MITLDLLLESFRRNAQANANLLQLLAPTDFQIPVSQGWALGQILAHMFYARPGWLSKLSPSHAEGIPAIAESGWHPKQLTATNAHQIAEAFQLADAAALAAVQDAIRENRSFKEAFPSHPAHFLQLIMIHDANHRGQILAALRQSGRSPEQMQVLEDAAWDPWFS